VTCPRPALGQRRSAYDWAACRKTLVPRDVPVTLPPRLLRAAAEPKFVRLASVSHTPGP
jgi:hypothetical protein